MCTGRVEIYLLILFVGTAQGAWFISPTSTYIKHIQTDQGTGVLLGLHSSREISTMFASLALAILVTPDFQSWLLQSLVTSEALLCLTTLSATHV